MLVSKVIEQMQTYYKPTDHIAVAVWSIPDIRRVAAELKKTCTKEQANEILDRIDHKQDAEIGINWDVIKEYVYDLPDKAPRKRKKGAI